MPGEAHVVALERREVERPHEVRVLPETVEKARKAEVRERADDAARGESDSIRQVSATYADGRRRVLIANSDGLLAEDDVVRTRFMVNCVAVGDTLEEMQREIQEAIAFHLEGLRADGLPVPEPSSRVEYIEVIA